MTREEAKETLLIYRPGTTDGNEPEIAQALALALQDAELARWLDQHQAQQEMLRAKFRQIPVPAGLKEQIISERAVNAQKYFRRKLAVAAGALAVCVLIGLTTALFWPRPPNDDTFANYRNRMVSTALRGYSMNFESPDLAQIRAYLAQRKAAENYDLPARLQKITATGCAVETWQGARVAMICFRTGQPLRPGDQNDLWLFVVDSAAVKNAPNGPAPQFARVNKLITAAWMEGNKLYLLGTAGDEQKIREYL
ncbi:MAG TPA: hypothetical protein VFC44_10015 [Candidatus Saccharimonadales bacterium]|nr:hypothetical protein [Candidatus Saccharimonadales bacterium]